MTRRMLLDVDGTTCAVETRAETPLIWVLSWVMREPRLSRIENTARAMGAPTQASARVPSRAIDTAPPIRTCIAN